MSADAMPEQFAILVRDIPSPPNGQTQKEFIDSFFREIYPETFYRSLVVTENSKVSACSALKSFNLLFDCRCFKVFMHHNVDSSFFLFLIY